MQCFPAEAGSLPRRHRFGADMPFRLGVEEELLLADRQSLALAPVTERVLATPPSSPGRLKGELSDGMIELATDIVAGTSDVVAILATLRDRVHATGVGLLGTGLHPTAPFGDVKHRGGFRYAMIGDDTRGLLRMTPHCGLHVHVGMPDAESAIRACNGMRAGGFRCCWRSPPTRRSGTAATRAWPAPAP